MNTSLIVLVEDDKFQRGDFVSDLKSQLPDAKVEVFSCGVEFLDAYEKRPDKMPDVFVIDLMLDWRKELVQTSRPIPNPAPEQRKTAMMCFEAVRNYSTDVPVILWTMSDLNPPAEAVDSIKTFFRKKDRDIEGDVYNLIRKLLSSRK
jgi:CheY-like chemotaxis protein